MKSIRMDWLTTETNSTLSHSAIDRRRCGRSAWTASRGWSRPKRGSISRSVSPSAYFRDQSEREREADGPLTAIRIEGEPDTLNAVCEHWHLRHYLTERTDREARFLLDVPTMNKYLPIYLMTFGTAIRIREPLGLKRRIQEIAQGIANHYEDDPD
ncbi:hypothetical protein [Paenibacillus hodogayensis]|uniref:hypothetical protein n=1 Tax=Paenibacillus hodogayensis TaxID=279208 RepID=UPI0033817FA0